VEEITNEEKVSFGKAQIEAFKAMRRAFEMDAERAKLLRDSGREDPTPNKNVKEWWKNGWKNVLIWAITALIVWAAIQPKKDKRRSHHGVNKFGVPY